MDDRDLESRLRTHLHARFDAVEPSSELLAGVRQILTTGTRRVGSARPWSARLTFGWSGLVAVALIALLALIGARFGGLIGPGGPGATPSGAIPSGPRQGPALERWFLVMPPTSALPSKADSSLAADVLRNRLGVFGFQSIVTGVGYAIQFRVPGDGPSDLGITIRNALAATGDVRFVPLPPADYGDGKLHAQLGARLPKDELALFGWEGIASVTGDASTSPATLQISLKPQVADAFADYTQSNVGQSFAIVVDGRVALLPRINEPILGGQIQLAGGIDDDRFAETVSILVGGKLPEAWANPVVPVILPLDEVQASAEREMPGAALVDANLEAIQDASTYGWREVWVLTFEGEFPIPCASGAACPATEAIVTVDATSGETISRTFNP